MQYKCLLNRVCSTRLGTEVSAEPFTPERTDTKQSCIRVKKNSWHRAGNTIFSFFVVLFVTSLPCFEVDCNHRARELASIGTCCISKVECCYNDVNHLIVDYHFGFLSLAAEQYQIKT